MACHYRRDAEYTCTHVISCTCPFMAVCCSILYCTRFVVSQPLASIAFLMSGFDCEFTEEPPQAFQTHCPICLLVLCEPFQVTCCGKSFCRECIQRIEVGVKPCPTCNEARFDPFQNKGLQQPLYGFRVFCSNKESGCDWQGELGQLDQHLNVDPDKDKQFQGCVCTKVKCLYCNVHHRRHEIEHHQTSQCAERPFTCSLCEEYESTYAALMSSLTTPLCASADLWSVLTRVGPITCNISTWKNTSPPSVF